MKKQTMIIYNSILLFFLFMLVSCTQVMDSENNDQEENNMNNIQEENNMNNIKETNDNITITSQETNTNHLQENKNDDSINEPLSENSLLIPEDKGGVHESLDQYSSEQIEYARVWLQLGPNKQIDQLYVKHISAGELVNPNDESSATYPENVIQLSGSRLVDGSITYSGNGDGTINVYNVPLRFENDVPEELDEDYTKELTEKIIENQELVSVDVGDDEEVINFIKILHLED